MQDRRLSGHQLRGMYSLYDRVELVVEGVWRPGEGGEIMVPNGRTGTWTTYYNHARSGISFRQVDSYLYSQYECGGVAVWRTGACRKPRTCTRRAGTGGKSSTTCTSRMTCCSRTSRAHRDAAR